MQKIIITCDICNDEVKSDSRPREISLTERSGNASKPHHYEHICPKCENEIVHFIEEGLKKKPKE